MYEVKALQDQLKQILYGCVEHVQATRAALYLSSSTDLNEKRYELVTSYAFNDAQRKVLNATDDLVDRLAVKRNAFFVNGLSSDTRLSEMLFRQGTDRLLAAPLFARGRLLGFIDMRDKAGKKPFGNPDLDAARVIADQVLNLLTNQKLFGLAPTPLSAADDSTPKAMNTAISDQRYDLSAPAVKAIEAARLAMAKRQLAPTAAAKKVLTESDVEIVRLLLPAALAIPGAVLACFSAIGHVHTPQSIVAIAEVTEDAIEALETHLQAWFKGVAHKEFDLSTSQPQIMYPFGEQIVPVSAAGISTILSAPVNAQSFEGLVLTVAFERVPAGQAQRALTMFLRQIENSVESAIMAGGGRSDRQVLAEKLLEPDFQRFPELVDHCRQVSIMSQRLATIVGLSPHQVEIVRLAGLVHDVGLRLLDYERLYRRPSLTPEELRGLAEHPIVGAAIVEPLLGPEVAHAVLRHHERVDGKGYPSHISGQTIPLASRIIQVCDAWVAMTSAASYQAAMPRGDAARRIRQAAGTQFDEAVVARFLKSLNEIID
jgi:HD-GYP domain-containing protein (c-di-GMP phosphodiesterase class II)